MIQALKYNQDNYIKHPRMTLIGNDFKPFEAKLNSDKLLIRWHCLKSQLPAKKNDLQGTLPDSLIGSCQRRVITPIGHLFPDELPLKVAIGNEKLIQFLDLEDVDMEYTLYFKNPLSIAASFLEVWEYNYVRTGKI